MVAAKNRGLGKGLEALFGEVNIDPQSMKTSSDDVNNYDEEGDLQEKVAFINIHEIKPNENQPRKKFDEEKLRELGESILAHGIIQPIVVRNSLGGRGYEIVAGERRWRASVKAGLKKIPCLIRELSDEQNMLLSIIENTQREDLSPIEEALAMEQMLKTYGLTQEQIAGSLGKSRPYVANSLRLLKLPSEIQDLLGEGSLSAGHARALITVESKERQFLLAKKTVEEGLSVREIERLATAIPKEGPAKRREKKTGFSEVYVVEEALARSLGTKVNIKDKGKQGKIEIEYYSREELERLLELLKTLG